MSGISAPPQKKTPAQNKTIGLFVRLRRKVM